MSPDDSVVVAMNRAVTEGLCPLCREQVVVAPVGPILMSAGTREAVCDACATAREPILGIVVRLGRIATIADTISHTEAHEPDQEPRAVHDRPVRCQTRPSAQGVPRWLS